MRSLRNLITIASEIGDCAPDASVDYEGLAISISRATAEHFLLEFATTDEDEESLGTRCAETIAAAIDTMFPVPGNQAERIRGRLRTIAADAFRSRLSELRNLSEGGVA